MSARAPAPAATPHPPARPPCLDPGQVRELGVDRNAEHLRVERGKLGDAVGERGDLGRAHKREVERVEEEHHVLAAVLGETGLLEFLIHDGGGCEIWSLQAN